MKKLFGSVAAVVIVAFMISMNSCEEVEGIIPIPSMKATVDGVAWTSLVRISVFNESGIPQSIVITGKPTADETADETIVLTVFGNDVGTYQLNTATQIADCGVVYNKATDTDTDIYTSTEATITISKMDKEKNTISGTFSAKCVVLGTVKEVMITDGTFENLNYQIK
ncbi:MAG: DUF6252 family protein [Bacteroidota bacterium]